MCSLSFFPVIHIRQERLQSLVGNVSDWARLEDDDMEAFIDNIHKYYEDFDVDEEAYIWIGSDGHGKNGAPYHIADIVKDMEEAEVMMADLYEAFKQYYSQLELQAVWQ